MVALIRNLPAFFRCQIALFLKEIVFGDCLHCNLALAFPLSCKEIAHFLLNILIGRPLKNSCCNVLPFLFAPGFNVQLFNVSNHGKPF